MSEQDQEAVPIADQIACVRREIAMRGNVYPKWVAVGRLKPEEAEREQKRMRAVHASLERLAAMDDHRAATEAATAVFVLGYAFTHGGQVMMIRKGAGTPSGEGINGIGGRVYAGEDPRDAMVREWMEETGREEPPEPFRFRACGEFYGRGFRVHVFVAGPLDSWPAEHGRSAPESGIITADLASMLKRGADAHHGPGMATAMPLCPWVPVTLAMACLERPARAGLEPRLEIR